MSQNFELYMTTSSPKAIENEKKKIAKIPPLCVAVDLGEINPTANQRPTNQCC
jgi:hypothetical protein